MKKTKHPLAIKLVQKFIDRIPIHKTGTYNRQDPTHYEEGKTFVDTACGGCCIFMKDCTWGVEISIDFDADNTYELYFSRGLGNPGEIILREGTGMEVLKLIWILVKRMPELPDPYDEEPWMDPAGGMHYPGETDPAAQYE